MKCGHQGNVYLIQIICYTALTDQPSYVRPPTLYKSLLPETPFSNLKDGLHKKVILYNMFSNLHPRHPCLVFWEGSNLVLNTEAFRIYTVNKMWYSNRTGGTNRARERVRAMIRIL